MAMTGVLRPGHAQIRVLDMDESVQFYTDVMGLMETGRDASGRVYFKTRAERDHNSIVLRKADRAGLDFFGYKVLNKATLEELDGKLKAHGVATERIPAGDMLETGERVRFQLPTGHTIELYADKTDVGSVTGCNDPEVDVIDGKGIRPIRMDHALLYGGDIDGSRKLFEEVLGFSLVERVKLEDGATDLAVWLTCSAKAHDIAMVRHAEDGKLHHVAFQMASWEHVLRCAACPFQLPARALQRARRQWLDRCARLCARRRQGALCQRLPGPQGLPVRPPSDDRSVHHHADAGPTVRARHLHREVHLGRRCAAGAQPLVSQDLMPWPFTQ
jgi:catechol 2,3-dioxygenase